MLRVWTLSAVSILFSAMTGCNAGPHSPAGFRLPPTGDVERGKVAFVNHECQRCHSVVGVELPPAKEAITPLVALGGEKPQQVSDGFLVTSIIHPSYVVAPGFRKAPASWISATHMPDLGEQLSVRELTDIVAFLQSRYSVQRAPTYSPGI